MRWDEIAWRDVTWRDVSWRVVTRDVTSRHDTTRHVTTRHDTTWECKYIVPEWSCVIKSHHGNRVPLCLGHTQQGAPYDFYHPYDFLPVRPVDAPVRILRRCCSRGHIRLRAPYGLTRLHTYGLVEWFAGLHGYPVRCPYGSRTGPARESSMFFISNGTRTGPVRDPQGCRKGIDTTIIGQNPARASYLALRGPHGPLTVPVWAVHGLFTISKHRHPKNRWNAKCHVW